MDPAGQPEGEHERQQTTKRGREPCGEFGLAEDEHGSGHQIERQGGLLHPPLPVEMGDEGIALLKEGSKATLFIPYELGYGETGSPPTIPAKAELIFYVELEEVN